MNPIKWFAPKLTYFLIWCPLSTAWGSERLFCHVIFVPGVHITLWLNKNTAYRWRRQCPQYTECCFFHWIWKGFRKEPCWQFEGMSEAHLGDKVRVRLIRWRIISVLRTAVWAADALFCVCTVISPQSPLCLNAPVSRLFFLYHHTFCDSSTFPCAIK